MQSTQYRSCTRIARSSKMSAGFIGIEYYMYRSSTSRYVVELAS
eukprot:SAG25_NODE_542_length_7058_cov_1.916942_1_plen_43_part_10